MILSQLILIITPKARNYHARQRRLRAPHFRCTRFNRRTMKISRRRPGHWQSPVRDQARVASTDLQAAQVHTWLPGTMDQLPGTRVTLQPTTGTCHLPLKAEKPSLRRFNRNLMTNIQITRGFDSWPWTIQSRSRQFFETEIYVPPCTYLGE